MTKLTPVGHDPFANPARRLARAEGGMTLQRTAPFPDAPEGFEFYGPSDKPPDEGTLSGTPQNDIITNEGVAPGVSSMVGKIGSGIAQGVGNWLTTPGNIMQGPEQVQPEVPGQWSEEDQYRQNLAQAEHSKKETDFGGETALNLFGTSAPFVPKGTLGIAGGRPPIAPEAPQIAKPFYSSIERAVAEVPQAKASGDQWIATLRNRPGVKGEEMEWLGLEDWLKEQKGPVTKQQVADYVRDNQVQVNEVVKGGGPPSYAIDQELQKLHSENIRLGNELSGSDDVFHRGRIADQMSTNNERIQELQNSAGQTKFHTYTLPGGENYREMLLTLPSKASDKLDPSVLAEMSPQMRGRLTNDFHSSHFDEPNILAHVRFNDRVIDGKKTLFVEEVQSDWHQKGKREGYAETNNAEREALIKKRTALSEEVGKLSTGPEGRPRYKEILREVQDINERLDKIGMSNAVPNAPFKTTWPELAMKRIIRYAAENGYDKVAWTPGEVQASRYDLSQQIKRVDVHKDNHGNYNITAVPKEGGNNIIHEDIPAEKLPDIIGKELAEKIVNDVNFQKENWGVKNEKSGNWSPRFATREEAEKYQQSLPESTRKQTSVLEMVPKHIVEYEGLDLKVGGEGMKGFYDKILPAAVNKLVKKHGAKVGEGEISIRDAEHKFYPKKGMERKVHTLDITPSLRKSAMEQGFPQFAAGGRVAHANINHNPTEAQKKAGNYAKDHVRIHGLDITVENAKGKDRKGVGKNGRPWSVKMPAHYGYIKKTEGADGDHVDCYIGDDKSSARVFVVNQCDADSKKFDEHKCMIGFSSRDQALSTYKKGFSDGRGGDRIDSVTEMRVDQFKNWLKNGNTKRKRADGGAVDAPKANYFGNPDEGKFGKHGLDLSIPLTSSVDVTGRINTSPNLYGPGLNDYGARIGIRKRFAEGGAPDDDFIPGVGSEGVPSYAPDIPVSEEKTGIFKPSKYNMEPGLQETQLGEEPMPKGVAPFGINDAGQYTDERGEPIPEDRLIRRPGMLPVTVDPEGKPELAMPKIADIASNIMGGNVPGGGSFLGSGLARSKKALPGSVEPAIKEPYGTGPKAPASEATPADLQPGGSGGTESLAAAQRAAADAAGPVQPLQGLPDKPLIIGGDHYIPGPIERVHRVAEQYMKDAGLPYEPMTDYAPVSVPRAKSIARAFEEMPHNPNDPEVKASYDAMINETVAQLRALQKDGLQIEFIKPGQKDPYYESPRLAAKDLRDNNHLWVFPTDLGFGTEHVIAENPLLAKTGISIDGRELLANDAFRIVHDYFGHLKDGVGFRAAGEENAWRSHSRMYSPLARRAMTTETRGQNSWLNYGPHGEANRGAKSDQTIYADQKIGLLPEWVSSEGAVPYKAPAPQVAERYPQAGATETRFDKRKGKTYEGKAPTEEESALAEIRAPIREDVEAGNYKPYFDPEKRFDVNPEHYPPAVNTMKEAIPAKEATIEKYRQIAESPEASKRLMEAYKRGKTMPGARMWYAMGQLEKEFIAELGPEAGREAFKNRFGVSMSALTGGMSPEANLLAAQFGNVTHGKGVPYPTASPDVPYPTGGGKYGITGGLKLHGKMMKEGIGVENPKRHNFTYNFMGHQNIATIDEQMMGLFDPKLSLPPGDSYGVFEAALAKLAKKAGVSPREFQEVAWAGHKMSKEKNYVPHPMIETVNRAIERTHRITGMPRAEIVRRGLVRGEIPIYSKAPLPLTSSDQQRLTPVEHDPFETDAAIRRATNGD